MKDALTALVRTVVTSWWGVLVAWAVTRGWLPHESVDVANNFGAVVVLPLVTGVVYAAIRVAEAWLVSAAARGGALGGVAKFVNVVLAGVPKVPAY